ncbi:type I polyketide synthase, partial [Streptomyces mayteni]
MTSDAKSREPQGRNQATDEASDAVAVIGLACRFPGAPSPSAYWDLLWNGRHAITETPPDRWNADELHDDDPSAPGRINSRYGSYLDQDSIVGFDARFFGIGPREAAAMDPQQRLLLELSWEALEDAHTPPERLTGTATGVFVGAIWNDYAVLLNRGGTAAIHRHSFTGAQRGIIANRISYTFGLRGPSLVVDSAQSSSLVAVHLACESLRRGESTTALVGGVNLTLAPESAVAAGKMAGFSSDGRCYTFDARANGYVRGEGAAVVLLKPLSRAVADGDRIHAVIRGSAVNNDGGGQGLTAPDPHAQEHVIRQACLNAGVSPSQIQYVELHGTGTRVGDPVEAAALGAALGRPRDSDSGPLHVGSVKTNIGHLEGAAGIAGLVKTILSLRHRALPPSLNYETPNPHVSLDENNLRVQGAPGPWPHEEHRLIAGVSSFGMGGTNAHVIVEEAPAVEVVSSVGVPAVGWVVSGRSEGALRETAGRVVEAVSGDGSLG